MDLILLRHGKANDSNSAIEDARRRLTADGRKKLARDLPSLGLLVKNLGQAQIWTSTLDRSIQTAEILARLFEIENRQPHEFVGDGDFAALLASLAEVKKTATVVIVGHLPHLSDWCEKLLGIQIPFKKGAAAGIRIQSLQPLAAELLWFFQPQPLGHLFETLFANRHLNS